ncbi:MAG TPA: YncE family protein [Candidatus Acidoferrum sp.]|nr:YncE family protein [Candidatus Acidoferrum sp.]
MSFRRLGRLAAMVIPTLMCLSCGQVYRPVVIPCSAGIGIPGCPVESPPTPANFHQVFGISSNVPNNPGGAMQIDVAGDSIIAETSNSDLKFGENPTYAAILPNNSRLFVASAGSMAGDVDLVSFFTPAFQSTSATGFGAVTAISLPIQSSNIAAISEAGNLVTVTLNTPLHNVPVGYAIVVAGVDIPACSQPLCNPLAYDGAFPLSSISGGGTTITYVNPASGLPPLSGGTATFPPLPVFLGSTQNSAMYVANYNYNSVSAISTSLNAVSNSAAVGVHPVGLAETPNGNKLYVANQGDNTVSSLNVVTLSSNTVTVPVGITLTAPVWVVARGDSQKVYVLTQGDTTTQGQLVTIDTATDTATSSIPVGAGANFIFYDPHLNRLYVTNPNGTSSTNPLGSAVYVFSDTGGANDTPAQLAAIPFAFGSTACPSGPGACSAASVTALADGSRFYVASYQTATSCPDSLVGSLPCVIPSLAVFDARDFALKTTISLLTNPPFATNQYAVPAVTACGPVPPVPLTLYSPGATRFRVFTTAATDSSHVYVSMCDAGSIADINAADNNINGGGGSGTPADTLVADLPTAFSAGPTQPNGEPPNQNPILLLTGQ